MTITLTALQKQRRDTAANWTSNNPTLLAGELGYESDTGKWKVGDGSTAWTGLAYIPGSQLSAYPIVNADIASGAEIAVAKLADGSARQLLQTDAAGTGVEWTDNVDVPGTLDVTGTGTFDGNVTIAGDLTVNGTTTTINTQDLLVEDKNIIIGNVTTPSDVTADGGGITLKGTTDKTINWVDATDAWTLSEHVDLAAAKELRIGGTKVIDSTSLGSGVTGSSLTSVGTIGTGLWQGTTIATGYGGTGQTTYTDGQLLIGKTDGTLAKATITQGSGITITNGDGSITISATGSGGTVTSVTATSPLASTGGTTPDISIQAASTTQSGAVQLNDTTTSTSTTEAATANVAKNLADSLVLVSDVADAALPKTGGALTGVLGVISGSASAPSIYFDANSGIYSPGADQLALSTNGVQRINIEADGDINIDSGGVFYDATNNRLAIGTTSPGVALHVDGDIRADGIYGETDTNTSIQFPGSDVITFNEGGSEAARIDSSGRLLVGTSSASTTLGSLTAKLQIQGTSAFDTGAATVLWEASTNPALINLVKSRGASVGTHTVVQDNDSLGRIVFGGSDGTDFEAAAWIQAQVDGTPGANDMPGRLVFSTTADGASSPVERWRINSIGTLKSTGANQSSWNIECVRPSGASQGHIRFINGSSEVGYIATSTTNTMYVTSSDYRLKENVVAVADGITRLQQLKPSRFNFIADPNTVVDGFIAHEVQAVVPEAVIGEKDAVDDEGNPQYQGIDQSKLVPLLTAALQEAISEIESLKARVAALENA